jgi:hypothetical protein
VYATFEVVPRLWNLWTGKVSLPEDGTVPVAEQDVHAVQIVGYQLDRNGRIAWLKIASSWGEGAGDAGFFHMSGGYFSWYVVEIGVSK